MEKEEPDTRRRAKEAARLNKMRQEEAQLKGMLEKAAAAVARKLGKWELLRTHRGVKARTLEIMANRDNPAFTSIRRRSDGTVHASRHGKPQQDEKLLSAQDRQGELTAWIRAELLNRAAEKIGDPQRLTGAVYGPRTKSPNVWWTLQDTANRVAWEAVQEEDASLKELDLKTKLEAALRRAHAELTGKDGGILESGTLETARKLMDEEYTSPLPTPNAYNWVHLNRTAIKKLEKATPGVARYYTSRCWDPRQEPGRMHPGDIIRAVRDQTQLTKSEWKVFCRIGPERFLRGFPPPEDEEQPSTIQLICRAVAQANQPGTSDSRLDPVIHTGRQCRFYHDARWQAGDAWRAWVNLLSRYLDPRRQVSLPEHLIGTTEEYRSENEELNRTEDALRNHVERQMPWGPGDWDTLTARSERWHREIFYARARMARVNMENGMDAAMEAAWTSALRGFEEKGVAASPVTTGRELHRLGEEMGNCLGSYTSRCQEGESRIFHITQNGQTAAAAEISRTGKSWMLRHTEAPRRGPIADAVRELAGRLPDLYALAERKT